MKERPQHEKIVYFLRDSMINNGYVKMMIGENYHFVEKGITAMDSLFAKSLKSEHSLFFNDDGEDAVLRAAGHLIDSYALRAETQAEDDFINSFVLLGTNALQFFKREKDEEKQKFQDKLRVLKILSSSKRTMADMAQSMRILLGISKKVNTFRPSMFQVNNDYVKRMLGECSKDEV